MSRKSQAPCGSFNPTDEVKCAFLVSNIRPSTPKDAIISYFGCYGKVIDWEYVHVHPFTLKNSRSVLTFTRSFVVTLQLTNDMKNQVLCHWHTIHDMTVSVKEYKGISEHIEELDGCAFKFHFLLQSFTDLTLESHVIRLLENQFNGMNCRIRLVQTDYETDSVATLGDGEEAVLRDWYFDEPDLLPFKGDAVISFFLKEEYDNAKEIAKRWFPGCRITKWDPRND